MVESYSSMCRVIPSIYLGGYLAAADASLIKKLGITHVAKMFADDPSYPGGAARLPFVNYFVAPTKDQPNYDIRKDMLNAMLFIRMAVSDGGVVLVHCHAGISRSVTVMLAYLMFFEGMILEDALKHLRQRRPQANPNRGFMRCLKKFENQLLAPYYSSDPANLSKYYSHQ